MSFLGILFALASAAIWGGGDFSGGLAARRISAFQVLALSALSGLVALGAVALITREPFPTWEAARLALLAGVAGSVGLAALYRGLATGSAAVVAPISGVLGAALPVLFTAMVAGAPAPLQMVGFALAIAGIFLVSQVASGDAGSARRGFWLAVVAGIGFGVFFILIAEAEQGQVFTPLILSRVVQLAAALLLMRVNRLPVPSFRGNPVALLAGVLDAGGNVFYILAGQLLRLDVAAVIASLYPASTVILSGILLKEKITAGQRIGVILCLAAILLITL